MVQLSKLVLSSNYKQCVMFLIGVRKKKYLKWVISRNLLRQKGTHLEEKSFNTFC